MVVSAGYHGMGGNELRSRPEFISHWQIISDCSVQSSEAVGASSFVVLVEDSDTGGASSVEFNYR